MTKTINKLYLLLFLSFSFLFINTKLIYAADLTMECTASNCEINDGNAALFKESNIKPLDTYTRSIIVTNNDETDLRFTFRVSSNPFRVIGNSMEEFILLSIHDSDNNKIIEKVSLDELQSKSISLGTIKSDKSDTLYFTATIADLDNEYQNAKIEFDLDFVIDGLPAVLSEDATVIETIKKSPDSVAITLPSILGVSELPITGRGLFRLFLAGILLSIGAYIRLFVIRNKND